MWLVIIIFALVGGWISRMHGGAKPHIPFSPDAWLYAIPFGFVAFSALSMVDNQWIVWGITALSYATAFLGKRTGHGGWMDLGTWLKERTDEALEFIIKPLKGRISVYWYDVIGLCLTGILVHLGTGVALGLVNPLVGGLFILSGCFKGLSYMIGWKIYPDGQDKDGKEEELDEATEIGEFLTGIFDWGICGFLLFI